MKLPTEDDPDGAPHAKGMTGSHTPNCLREGTGPTSRFAKGMCIQDQLCLRILIYLHLFISALFY